MTNRAIYSTAQAADYLGVSVQTIKNWLAAGKITPLGQIGKSWAFSKEELDRLAAQPRHAGWPRGKPRKKPKDTA